MKMKSEFNTRKALIVLASYNYFEDCVDKRISASDKECLKFICNETGITEEEVLRTIFIDYTISSNAFVEHLIKTGTDIKKLKSAIIAKSS